MDVTQEIIELEDWDSYKGQDTQDEKPFDKPPVIDIKNGFESALSGEMHFNGEFAHSNVYEDAPNPCLFLEGLGPIGLPLNKFQAEPIMGASTTGEGIEKDIWNFPGHLIRSNNPQWETWLKNTVVSSIHKALDASVTGLSHDIRLKSLSIRVPHSEKKSCPDECGEDSRYASLTLVLPSPHVGGNVQHSYQGRTKTFHTSGHGSFATVAIGSYSGTTQAFDPLDAGYVVSLHYELHCFGNPNIIPRLPHLEVAQNQLQLVFRCWRHALDKTARETDDEGEPDSDDEEGSCPPLILCRLDNTYPEANFKAVSLEGADRLMLTQIAPLAKSYGFELHLGSATYQETGNANTGYDSEDEEDEEDYYGDRWGRCYYNRPERSEPEIIADDLEMDEVESSGLEVGGVVALDGMPMTMYSDAISEAGHGDNDDDVDSFFVNGTIKDDDRSAKFEADSRSCGTLTHTWTSQVIIISPEESFDVTFRIGDIRNFASQYLNISFSEHPTKKETTLVDNLIKYLNIQAHSQSNPKSTTDQLRPTATCLRESADRWNDVGLFRRILTACGPGRIIDIVGAEGLVSAYQAFDWAKLYDLYTEAISKATSNDLRGRLVDQLLTAATDSGDTTTISWCHTQRESVLDTLQTLKISEIDWALNLILSSKADATAYLRDKFLPQLHTVQPSDIEVWSALLTRLADMSKTREPTSPSFDKILLQQIISGCLRQIAATMNPYPPVAQTTSSYGYNPYRAYPYNNPTQDEAKPLYQFIELCARCGSMDASTILFERMWDQNTRTKHDSANSTRPASTYYSALVQNLDSFLKTNPQHRDAFKSFFDNAIAVLLPKYSTSTAASSVKSALKNLNDPLSVLHQRLTAETISTLSEGSLDEFGKWVSSTFSAQSTTPEAKTKLGHVLTKCLGRLLSLLRKHLRTSTPPSTNTFYNHYSSYSSIHGNGMQIVNFAIQTGLRNHTSLVLDEYLKSPKANDESYINSTLIPFLEGMASTLSQHKVPMNASLVAEAIKKYTRYVLKQKPVDQSVPIQQLQSIGCGCVHCKMHLTPFFISERTSTDIRAKQKERTHLEGRLAKTRVWGVTWQTMRYGSPHCLRIEKPQKMIAVSTWAGKQTKASKLVQLLGNAVAQRQALGSDYLWVVGTIAGTERPPPLQAKTNTVTNTTATTASTILKRTADPSSNAIMPPAKVPRMG